MNYEVGSETQREIAVEIPDESEDWSVGLITGPSGSGKTQLLRRAFPDWINPDHYSWEGASFLDDFGEASVESISRGLAAVGLSSVPAWMLPFSALSNGQRQRASLARALLEGDRIVFDEFSSLLDRVVARTASIATSKAVRRAGKRLVVATCHEDIAESLEADWILDMATGTLARGRLQRPPIICSVHPAPRAIWPLFKAHHYLSGTLSKSARCFVGVLEIGDTAALAAFMSFIPNAGHPNFWRGHRAVVLPEYQGIGIGYRFVDACFAVMAGEDSRRRLSVVSSSLPLNIARHRSANWRLTRCASHAAPQRGLRDAGSSSRLTTAWEWVRRPETQAPACCDGAL